jgi:hypothetical protein
VPGIVRMALELLWLFSGNRMTLAVRMAAVDAGT